MERNSAQRVKGMMIVLSVVIVANGTMWPTVFLPHANYNIRHLCAKVRKSHARAHASIIIPMGSLTSQVLPSKCVPFTLRVGTTRGSRPRWITIGTDPPRMLTARMDHDWSWTSSRNKAKARG